MQEMHAGQGVAVRQMMTLLQQQTLPISFSTHVSCILGSHITSGRITSRTRHSSGKRERVNFPLPCSGPEN